MVLPVVAMALAGSVACEDQPDKFELTGGVPVIDYVRVPDAESADSIITGAYLSAINAENQQIIKQTPNFTPKNVKLGVFVLFMIIKGEYKSFLSMRS